MESKKILEKEYNDLQTVHSNSVRKLHNIQKKIRRLQKDTARLTKVADKIIDTNMRNGFKIKMYRKKMNGFNTQTNDDTTPIKFRSKLDYAVRCIDWLKKNRLKNTPFSKMSIDSIICSCHREIHNDLLKGFTFTLSKECTPDGCMSWTYGQTHCFCGKTRVYYDKKNINYGYGSGIHIDDTHPLYCVSFYH